jgi:hypothetical protein
MRRFVPRRIGGALGGDGCGLAPGPKEASLQTDDHLIKVCVHKLLCGRSELLAGWLQSGLHVRACGQQSCLQLRAWAREPRAHRGGEFASGPHVELLAHHVHGDGSAHPNDGGRVPERLVVIGLELGLGLG